MMPSTLLGLGAPFTAVLVHSLAYRLVPQFKKFPAQKLAALIILFTVLITLGEAYYLGLGKKQMFHAGMLSLLLGYSYFHFFNMSETARRIRILVEYVAKIPPAQNTYDAEKIYGNRMARLREHGMLVESNGKLFVKHGPMLWASYIIMGWRKLFY